MRHTEKGQLVGDKGAATLLPLPTWGRSFPDRTSVEVLGTEVGSGGGGAGAGAQACNIEEINKVCLGAGTGRGESDVETTPQTWYKSGV